MKINNDFLSLEINDNILKISNIETGESTNFNWPAIAIGFRGKRIIPDHPLSAPEVSNNIISQKFKYESFIFTVSLTLSGNCWFFKSLDISSDEISETPDYVEVDSQNCDDLQLGACGYHSANQPLIMDSRTEEESTGKMPGCGYPLIGEKYFIGLEHPAAFNSIEENESSFICYSLRHFPQWQDGRLEIINAVFGWSENPKESFLDYLNTIRIPILDKPLVSYCTFWSDPYIGNYEYAVKFDNYMSFFEAYNKLKLRPDVFTLDAGWNDRESIFQAKEDVHRDEGLLELSEYLRENGAELSLWISHNGPMGIDPDYFKQIGIEVGSGNSSAYCGSGYGVLMDSKLETALTERFCKLVKDINVIHFKIDWDNECATNSNFNEKYPTVNHVRQASLNTMFRINEAMREINPDIITRNGWWVSPWWLCHANHLWLCQSGDSEFAALPSKCQRESASTHRDLMYYNIFQRDKSAVPLDCIDNHEFPDALRNPFTEEPVSWTNAVWLSFMRGSTYIAYTLQPESLEGWQVESLQQITQFCREYSKHIFVKDGRMILGNPGKGEIYGFMQPGVQQSWCLLRNPLPFPQKIRLDFSEFVCHDVGSVKMFYPYFEQFSTESELMFLAHEAKVIIIDQDTTPLEFNHRYIVEQCNGKYGYRFPASLIFNDKIKPLVKEIYQLPEIRFEEVEKSIENNETTLKFTLTAPYRIRNFELQCRIKGTDADKIQFKIFCSRYPGVECSGFGMPVTEIPFSPPGYGEEKNPDSSPILSQKFLTVSIPDGGISHYFAQLKGYNPDSMELEIWAAGYEAPSREALIQETPPAGFEKCLPYHHPLGFPIAAELI